MNATPVTAEFLQTLDEPAVAALLEHHNHCYWDLGEPEITDDEYDLLMRRLEALNPTHPLLTAVHAVAVAGNGKVRHAAPMLSLDKAYSLEAVLEWATKHARSSEEQFRVQPKYDGISANYDGRILATRGDGVEGEDITAKLPLLELETTGYRGPVNRPVRGEIIIRDDVFREKYPQMIKKDGNPYKNSRNAVAGIMGLKEIDEILYQIQHLHAWLTLVDYEMVSYRVNLQELRERWTDLVQQIEALPYPMDGIVIKLDDRDYSLSLGYTAHHPRGQIAFKFSGIRQTSRLLDVVWSFGKNCLTPVAEIEPIEISGTTIRHATLHNAQNLIDKNIQIGDLVTVERAGDVIPYIVSAEPGEARTPALIDCCPCCQTALVRRGPELCCPNPDCFETKVQRLTAAVKNIGIERLGEPNIRRLMQVLHVSSLKDIFRLKTTDLLQLAGFQEKAAANLYREIQAAHRVPDYQLVAALNIPGIGANIAKLLLNEYTLDELCRCTTEQLSAIRGIGPERAAALEKELREQQDFITEMLGCIELVSTKSNAPTAPQPTICFTGKMPEKRSYYEKLAADHGYQAVETVTQTLALLVAADPTEPGSKLDKARKAGIRIVRLDEWLAGLGSSVPLPPDDLFAATPSTPNEPSTSSELKQGMLGF